MVEVLVGSEFRNPDADRDGAGFGEGRVGDLAADLLRASHGVSEWTIPQQNDEFLASPPRDEVAVANRLPQPAGHLDEHPVADLVSVGVVDGLEVVDIDHQYRLHFRALGPGRLGFQ